DGDGADGQALHELGLAALPHDELCAAAADVHHQAPLAGGRHVGADAPIYETRLLDAADDLDGMAQHAGGFGQEVLAAAGGAWWWTSAAAAQSSSWGR